MLSNLSIQNFALIDELNIDLSNELNIITGETGAGKSIILGALGLLLGNRADGKALYSAEKKCIVEGTFSLKGLELEHFFTQHDIDFEEVSIIRREISTSGKSRAFINDTPVVLSILKELTSQLIDVHSQHDTLLLGSSAYQLEVLDAFAENQKLRSNYKQAYKVFVKAKRDLATLQESARGSKEEFDYNNFLWEELDAAHIKIGEKENAEQELIELENAETVQSSLSTLVQLLSHPEQSVPSLLREGLVALNQISKYGTTYSQLADRVNSVLIELEDIEQEATQKLENLELNEERITELKDRLDLLFKLFQKHRVQDESSLLAKKEELSLSLKGVLDYDDNLKKLEQAYEKAQKELAQLAKMLSDSRIKVKSKLSEKVVGLLSELGMPNASFEVQLTSQDYDATGADEVTFLFSANKGIGAQPLKKVASGGEFSRLMLVLKYFLAQKKSLPSIIFDEIDTGISGEVAIKMGALLDKMASYMQVTAITHLHQIAGKGTKHFFVYKNDKGERTVSRIKTLNEEERIIEIAKMIGGENPSEAAIRNALEILESNNE